MNIKKFFLIILCVILALFCFCAFAAENEADEDEEKDTGMGTDLPIYAHSIKERERKNTALTDIYEINILTRESNEMQRKINEFDADSKQRMQALLLTKQSGAKTVQSMIREQAIQAEIFNKPHMYAESKTITENTSVSQIVLCFFIFAVLGAISFFSAVAFQQRKRRQTYVYNNNDENRQ